MTTRPFWGYIVLIYSIKEKLSYFTHRVLKVAKWAVILLSYLTEYDNFCHIFGHRVLISRILGGCGVSKRVRVSIQSDPKCIQMRPEKIMHFFFHRRVNSGVIFFIIKYSKIKLKMQRKCFLKNFKKNSPRIFSAKNFRTIFRGKIRGDFSRIVFAAQFYID